MTHKLSTAVFAQGWLDGQFEALLNKASEHADEDPTALLIATQMQEQWSVVSQTLDQLIKENSNFEQAIQIVRNGLALIK